MDARLQRRVQRYGWDRAAEEYERFWAAQLEPAQARLLDLAAVRPGERVLDVACGTGLVSLPAARLVGTTGRVIGTDLSERMVDAARTAARREGLVQATFERMGAEELTLQDGSVDVALCALGLMYVPDPVRALSEMRRVLRPGGRACSVVWGARDRCGWAAIFPIVDSRVESDVCPMFFQLGTGGSLAAAFEAAGFREVQVERMNVLMSYGSEDDAIGAAFAGGPVALAYSRFDERTRRDAHAEYLETIAPYRNGEGFEIPGEFVLAAARRP